MQTAKKAFAAKDFKGAKEILQPLFKERQEAKQLGEEVAAFYGDLLFALRDYPAHLKWSQERLKVHKKGSGPYLRILENVMDQYSKSNQQQLALPFYLTAMAEYVKKNDSRRLDVTYYHLAEAYRSQKDWKNLLKSLENHVAIKKGLGDLEGQLPLLDQMGKLLYDTGNQAASQKTYELAIEIRQSLEPKK